MNKPSALPEQKALTQLQQWFLDHTSADWKELTGWTPPGKVNSRGLVSVMLSLQKKGLIEAWRGKHHWLVRRTVRCGIRYPVGTPAPAGAKYACWYWGFVVYHTRKTAAEKTRDSLSYYEQEDAEVVRLEK